MENIKKIKNEINKINEIYKNKKDSHKFMRFKIWEKSFEKSIKNNKTISNKLFSQIFNFLKKIEFVDNTKKVLQVKKIMRIRNQELHIIYQVYIIGEKDFIDVASAYYSNEEMFAELDKEGIKYNADNLKDAEYIISQGLYTRKEYDEEAWFFVANNKYTSTYFLGDE